MRSVSAYFVLLCMALPVSGQDIDAFWRETRRKLAAESVEAQVEKVKDPLAYSKYKVTLRGLGAVRFVCWMSIPVQGEAPAKPWPVLITACGYGGWQQGIELGECQRGYAVIQVYPRGQGDSADLAPIKGDKLTAQLDRPEGAYYQGALADMLRAIDFAASRDDLDHDRIALVGGSQSGGMSLIVTALDPRIRAVVAHVPFLCNMPLAAQTPGSLVKTLLDRAARNNAPALATLAYFDPIHFADKIHVPVLMSAGGMDKTCPAATIQAVFDRIPVSDKTMKFYPALPHTTCLDFYNLTWPWLDANFRKVKTAK